MKTLLLLAGRSRRFWPLAEKTLFPVCGKTLLEHQVERLRAGGCDEVILVGGAHNLEGARVVCPDLELIEQEDLELGMRGALLSALPKVSGASVMIVGGNDVIEPSGYQAVIDAAKNVDGALLAYKVDRYFQGGYLTVEGAKITGIVEKPGEGTEPSDLVNIVAHVHNDPASLLAALSAVDESHDDGYEQALDALFKDKTYNAAPYDGAWYPVKYPWHMLPLLEHLLGSIEKQQIHKSASVHSTAIIDGNVVIEEGARVLEHATVRGPCTIGKRAIVANNALVRGSSVGDDCVVGYSTEVKGSVLHSRVWTHMTYLGDSVVGHNVSFGGGTITGNFRLDEAEVQSMVDDGRLSTGLTKCGAIVGDGCRLGIHVSINPGIKIGAGTFVSSDARIASDVPEGSFVSMNGGEMVVRENRERPPEIEGREAYRGQL